MVRRIVLSMSLVVLVAACGGDDDGADTTTAAAAGEDGSTTSATEPTDASDEGSDEGSGDVETLADYFGGFDVSDDPEAAEAEARQLEADIQEDIRRCMAEQGFEYLPALPPEGSFTFAAEDQREFAETQGFGITTWFGDDGLVEETETWVDPNQERIDAMSESEQEAYFEALQGSPEDQETVTEVDPETGEEITYSEGFGGGCSGEAYEAAYGEQEGQSEMWEELGPALEDMYERVEADPRIVAVNEDWSACMAEAGHEYASRSDMYEQSFTELQARFDEIVGPNGGFVDPMEGMTQAEIDAFFEESTQEEIDAFFADQGQIQLDAVDQEALEALQQEEIDIAVADLDCAVDYDDRYLEVAQEYESDFIAANRQALDEIRDSQGGG